MDENLGFLQRPWRECGGVPWLAWILSSKVGTAVAWKKPEYVRCWAMQAHELGSPGTLKNYFFLKHSKQFRNHWRRETASGLTNYQRWLITRGWCYALHASLTDPSSGSQRINAQRRLMHETLRARIVCKFDVLLCFHLKNERNHHRSPATHIQATRFHRLRLIDGNGAIMK